ncbi:MAG: condensation domain-containing protein, partial [Candidatus Sulfotelmatobacter sp.]
MPNTEGSSKTVKACLTEEETLTLLQRVPAAYNTQINDVLLTAFARAWSICMGSRVLFTNLEGHGRENLFDDVDLSRTVGWFTSIFPVRIEIPESGDDWQPGEALKSVKEQLLHIPQRGIGYGILRCLSGEPSLEEGPEAPVLFNYLGQLDQVTADSKLFRFAREFSGPWHSPKQRRRYPLEINSMVVDHRLEITCTHGSSDSVAKLVAQLADEFASALRELIAHCSTPEAKGRTSSDFPLAKLDQPTLDRLFAQNPDVEDVYPLSPIQTLFFSANSGGSGSAFDQWHCTLRGTLNLAAFQRAWQETVRRHPILRSTIHGEGLREPLQIVHRDAPLPWRIEDWRGAAAEQQAQRWTDFLKKDRAAGLSLTDVPAMRFALVRFSEDIWKFVWSVPPLLLDGWSWPVVYRDASRLYEALSQELQPRLESGRNYRSYIEWLGKQESGEAQAFWREYLAGFRAPTAFPTETPEPNGHHAGESYLEYGVDLSPGATAALNAAARSLRITVGTMLLAAWSLELNRQSGAGDI